MMKRIIPSVPYAELEDGLALFVDCLGFEVVFRDGDFAVVEREGAKAYLTEDPVLAALDRPQLAIETDTIDALYAEVVAKNPAYLHPDAGIVETKPWGGREFALRDRTGVCIIFRAFT